MTFDSRTERHLARFHSKWTEDDDGCRIWRASLNESGYGKFWDGARVVKAHRWIFLQMHGYEPPVVMHRCDKPACVNWERCLAPGTKATNSADMVAKGRQQHGSGHFAAKLTEADAQTIRDECAIGIITQRMLAEVFGIDPSCVSDVVTGASWRAA
jgi:hypothetical protein